MNDLISRAEAIRVASGYCHPANVAKELAKLPPAQPEYTEQDMREQFNAGYACGMHAAQPELAQDLPNACADVISRRALCEYALNQKDKSITPNDIMRFPLAQRWIPWDSGRFPEESGTYTVTAYDGVTNRVTYAKYQKRLKRWELTGARAYWRVFAWMPLPEPYKEGRLKDGKAEE